jgi:hypothetical protein
MRFELVAIIVLLVGCSNNETPPAASAPHTSPKVEMSTVPLRQHDVGPFGELSQRPNPDGLVVRHVPSFQRMIPIIEEKVGHKLTDQEIEQHRQAAPAIAVTPDQDRKMREVEDSHK